MVDEIWKPVARITGFSVSNYGRIRNDKTGTIRKTGSGPGGHRTIVFFFERRRGRSFNVATLVAHAFIGPPPHPSNRVVHLDGNPENNVASNLRWMRSAEVNHRSGSAAQQKLTHEQVKQLRRIYAQGKRSQQSIAAQFNVSQTAVSRAVNGKTWQEYSD